jgi:hypothetical protein
MIEELLQRGVPDSKFITKSYQLMNDGPSAARELNFD